MDRRLIKVEFPPAQAGIADALRRAFQASSANLSNCECDSDSDFAALLAKLH